MQPEPSFASLVVKACLRRLTVRYWRNLLRSAVNDVVWRAHQWSRRARIAFTPAAEYEAIRRATLDDTRSSWPPPDMTATLPARSLGHRADYFEEMLQSFVEKTERPARVEMLIRIDEDDDWFFFHDLKLKYRDRINMHFVAGGRNKGYAGVNGYYADLIPCRSASSRVWVLLSADTLLVLRGWDAKLLSAIDRHPYRDFFVATDCPFDEAISIIGPNPVKPEPVYWIRGSLFPVMGFGVLECTGEVALRHPGWTCVGNTTNVDGFAGDLLRRLWQKRQINLHVEIPPFAVENKPAGWHIKSRYELRCRNLLSFFFPENQAIRDEMVDLIADSLPALKSSSGL